MGPMTLSRDSEAMINARIAQIDHLISIQLNEVMHHPAFQKLEASWRGLKYLLNHSETGEMLKIKVFNAPKKIFCATCSALPSSTRARMFKKVYEEEFGIFGGHPFGALIGDYEFGKGPEDIELLEKISQVAAAAHAPFITAANSSMLNLESLHRAGRAPRSGQGFRYHGVCQVEELPQFGGFALRGARLCRTF